MNQEAYFAHVASDRGARGAARVRHQMTFLYDGIDFCGKTVLDIGGGTGIHSFYAIAAGAAAATVIEPEGDGGNNSMIETFERWRDALGAGQVRLLQTTLQKFEAPAGGFDIVLIQDAINHFDEPACITLRQSAQSRAIYDEIFKKIASLLRPSGQLVIADCSSQNLFPLLGLRNPIDPAIEWHKHQPPEVWVALAQGHGMTLERLRWSTPTKFGDWGRALFSSRAAAWMFTSHFAMSLRKGV